MDTQINPLAESKAVKPAPIPQEMSNLDKLRELIGDHAVAMFTTVAPDGALYTRPMVTQQLDDDGDFWFFSKIDDPKSSELQSNPNVNVGYVEAVSGCYVSVTGTAYTIQDREKAEELWSPAVKAWFPEGLEDPSLALIRVKVHTAEYWEKKSNFAVRAIEFAKAVVTGEIPDVAENKILKVN